PDYHINETNKHLFPPMPEDTVRKESSSSSSLESLSNISATVQPTPMVLAVKYAQSHHHHHRLPNKYHYLTLKVVYPPQVQIFQYHQKLSQQLLHPRQYENHR
ncbi:unnamed protein product, partial [Rotaria socialis]